MKIHDSLTGKIVRKETKDQKESEESKEVELKELAPLIKG